MSNAISDKEWDSVESEAKRSTGTYTHAFSKPFTYEGKTYDTLTFRFGDLTGKDFLAIEAECSALGISVVNPVFSGNFLLRMATRACEEKIGSDVLAAIPIFDFNRIRSRAQSFLLRSEQ